LVYRGIATTFTISGGTITDNVVIERNSIGGGVCVSGSTFIFEGGKITNTNKAPTGVSLDKKRSTGIAKWGAGGTYIKGGVSQMGGTDIVPTNSNNTSNGTDDTLIAIPKK
jgi:hypothetical protein